MLAHGWLSGSVWTYDPAAQGLKPKHNIFPFFNLFIELLCEKNDSQKEAGIGPYLKNIAWTGTLIASNKEL